MIEQVIFEVFVLYNITQVIVESTLFSKVRKIKILNPLLSCFLCTSIWISFILSLFLFNYAEYLGCNHFSWFFNGMFFSSITWFLHLIEGKLTHV